MRTNCARFLGAVGWMIFLTVATLASESAQPPDLYVATTGNDTWSGRLSAPNADRTDGPLATLTGARDATRKIRDQRSENRNSITVHVRGGVYRLDAPFVLEPQDSGVTFAAYQKEKPVFSGGRVLTGFRRNGKLWEAEIPDVKAGQWYFRQLFVNGQRRQRARSPNTGYHRIASQLPGPRDAHGKEIARDKFVFKPGDIQPWARLGDVNVVLMHSWETSIHPLKSVNTASNIVTFAAPLKEWWCIGYWEKNARYYVENALELLDQPGEWYLNRETGVLSYWPLPGERLGKTEVVAPRLTELVRLAGNADESRFVERVTLQGLAFHHSDWVLNPKGNSSTQAAVEVPAAVMADGALNCVFERCEVAHVGTYGVWFRRGCKDCRIQQNRLHDLGAGGVRVGEDRMAKTDTAESSRTLVDNNHIFDGGRVYAAGVGVWVAQSSHNRISHNDIHDLLYSGMSIGWSWGLETNRTHHNVIEFNHIHDCVHGTLSDAGLIYTLGVSPGSVIRNNVLHDLWPYEQPALGWGVYLDGRTGDYLIESNVVFNTLSGGLMFNNGGHAHLIRNNIFAFSANQALWPYSEKRPSTLRNNIVFLTQGTLLIPHGERSLNERLAAKEPPGDWDENLYWHTGGADQLRFYRHTFKEWQALGLDRHSLIADPQFVNAARRDFRLKPKSPALALDFQPIDTSRVGLYGDPAWVNEARHARCRVHPLPPPPPAPKPLTVNDDFEKTATGLPPNNARVDGEANGASIRVSDERAANGKHSLKITDSKTLKPTWQPHFYYQPHMTSGIVRESFDVWLAPEAQFGTEWRDSTAYPHNIGPSISFSGSGGVIVGGKTLARMPAGTWFHVEIEAALGKDAPRTFKLTLTPHGRVPQVFSDLPISGSNFHEVHWLGFSSTAAADTAFYLDNLRISQKPDKVVRSSR